MKTVEPGTKVMRDDGTGSAAWYRIVGVNQFEICTKKSADARVKRRTVRDESAAERAVDSFFEGC